MRRLSGSNPLEGPKLILNYTIMKTFTIVQIEEQINSLIEKLDSKDYWNEQCYVNKIDMYSTRLGILEQKLALQKLLYNLYKL